MPKVKTAPFREVTEPHIEFLTKLSQTKRPQQLLKKASVKQLNYLNAAAHNLLRGTFQLQPNEFQDFEKTSFCFKKVRLA